MLTCSLFILVQVEAHLPSRGQKRSPSPSFEDQCPKTAPAADVACAADLAGVDYDQAEIQTFHDMLVHELIQYQALLGQKETELLTMIAQGEQEAAILRSRGHDLDNRFRQAEELWESIDPTTSDQPMSEAEAADETDRRKHLEERCCCTDVQARLRAYWGQLSAYRQTHNKAQVRKNVIEVVREVHGPFQCARPSDC